VLDEFISSILLFISATASLTGGKSASLVVLTLGWEDQSAVVIWSVIYPVPCPNLVFVILIGLELGSGLSELNKPKYHKVKPIPPTIIIPPTTYQNLLLLVFSISVRSLETFKLFFYFFYLFNGNRLNTFYVYSVIPSI